MSLGGAIILAGLLSIFGGSSGKPDISDLSVALEERNLEVGFTLRGAFNDELIERIDAGLPSGFRYQFKLVRPTRFWFDNTLASSQLEVEASYNAVTREYQVNFKHNGKLTDSRVLSDREELEEALTRVENFSPFPLEGIGARKPVHLRVRAKLGSRNLLLLIPTTIHTEWVESERFLLEEAPGSVTPLEPGER
jgi:hypothetical protein